MHIYPASYHAGIQYLVQEGAHGRNRNEGRKVIAETLRACRRIFDRERVRWEYRHLLSIAGMFPEKEGRCQFDGE